MFAKIKKYLTDYNVKVLENKSTRTPQEQDALNNMKYGIGRTE